jgi:hypothetical protein
MQTTYLLPAKCSIRPHRGKQASAVSLSCYYPIIGEAYAIGGTGGCGTCAKVLYFGLYLQPSVRHGHDGQPSDAKMQKALELRFKQPWTAHAPGGQSGRTCDRSVRSSLCFRTDRSNSAPKTPSLHDHPARSRTLRPSPHETAAGNNSTPRPVNCRHYEHQLYHRAL